MMDHDNNPALIMQTLAEAAIPEQWRANSWDESWAAIAGRIESQDCFAGGIDAPDALIYAIS